VKSLLNLRCHVYFDPTIEKNMRNTHTNQGLDNPFQLLLPLLFSAKSINTAQTYPSVALAGAYPKPKKGPLQNKITAFQHYKLHFKKPLFPPLWQPLTVIHHHKTPHDQVFSRLHLFFCKGLPHSAFRCVTMSVFTS